MWIDYMRTALKGAPVAAFIPPDDVTKKGSEYIQKGVKLKKQEPIVAKKTDSKAKSEAAKQAIREKPVESLF
jgi:membrane carboxypeptidase/penicillin-binding protein